MESKAFSKLQSIGKAFMLPIALLPVAGLFLGIGAAFTNPTNIGQNGWSWLAQATQQGAGYTITEGSQTVLYNLFFILKNAGEIVFANLPMLFAIGVALGLAKAEKGTAALAGAVFFFVMHQVISSLLSIGFLWGPRMATENLAAVGQTTTVGIQTLEMGVFAGIIAGLIVSALHNKYYKIQLPQSLSFFGGTRFVPIVSAAVAILVGFISYLFWPFVQIGISALGGLVQNSGYAGTFIYGLIERSLIPFGLHHVFYLPFWQTAVGGQEVINGETVTGAQNILFAEMAAGQQLNINYARFMAGKFPFMMFGLPAAALAMYHTAKDNKKKIAAGLLASAAFTAFLTGITEPIEFTFLFVAPFLYAIHAVLAGLSFMFMHILDIPIAQTFSGGAIDFVLFGIGQSSLGSHWVRMLPLGLAYAVVYYFLFRFIITKFNLKTPGREDDTEETKMYTKEDYKAQQGMGDTTAKLTGTDRARTILAALGGKENVVSLDNCATRLRLEVNDSSLVDEATLKATGAKGVVKSGKGVQVVYGPHVNIIKSEIEEL